MMGIEFGDGSLSSIGGDILARGPKWFPFSTRVTRQLGMLIIERSQQG